MRNVPVYLRCHAIIGRPGRFYRAFEPIEGVEIDQIFRRYEITEEQAALERERERNAAHSPEALAQIRRRRRRRAQQRKVS